MGDEEDAAVLRAVRVEGAEPGLAEAGGEDDEAGGVAFFPCLLERSQGLLLDGVGGRDWRARAADLAGPGPRPPPAVAAARGSASIQSGVDLAGGGVGEEAVEGLGDVLECAAFAEETAR